MEASNGQIHHHDEQPRAEQKIIIDTDPGIGAYYPLLSSPLLSSLPLDLQGRPKCPMLASLTRLALN